MKYNDLPEGNDNVEKRDRNQASKLRAEQGRLIAQYKSQNVSMVIYEWHMKEYEEPYVIMIHSGKIDRDSLHRPDVNKGVYSPDTVIECVNIFCYYIKSGGVGSFSDQMKKQINEPWGSIEEYENHKEEELHSSAREEFKQEKELRELHGTAREEFEEEKELRELHEIAREEWSEEKRSRRIVEELEINKYEYDIPKMPKVPEKVDEIHHRYIEGDITLVEMQRQIDNAMSDL